MLMRIHLLAAYLHSKLFGYNSNQKRTTKPAWDSVFSISYAYFAYVCRLLPER
ncbi:Uncharacterised protein [Vibrio cholerae]|nr:Uncharacterised protein [Vibrio cholerae]CSC53973.1 Uncharacterised protein [Vibrio cholerae]CSC55342.1 Uncharacterised protein [Vibrio cholerae]CSD05048.1 Uncharacterised protein [Vibrio cholerae]CSI52968.1 Uncharacterised protein [Vibrio cholerae]